VTGGRDVKRDLGALDHQQLAQGQIGRVDLWLELVLGRGAGRTVGSRGLGLDDGLGPVGARRFLVVDADDQVLIRAQAVPLDHAHHLAWPGREGGRARNVDLAPHVQIGQVVGCAGLGGFAILGRIFEHDVPAFGRDGKQLDGVFEMAAFEFFGAAVKGDGLIRVGQAGLVRAHIVDHVALGLVQDVGILVRGEDQVPLAA
jgi:hypothetical protein